MDVYLKFNTGTIIHHLLLKSTMTASTDFIRNSCGMELITSRILPSTSFKFLGLAEQTCTFNQPPQKSRKVLSQAFMVSWRIKGPTIIPHHTVILGRFSIFFTGSTRIFSRLVVAVITVYKLTYVEYSFITPENIFERSGRSLNQANIISPNSIRMSQSSAESAWQ